MAGNQNHFHYHRKDQKAPPDYPFHVKLRAFAEAFFFFTFPILLTFLLLAFIKYLAK